MPETRTLVVFNYVNWAKTVIRHVAEIGQFRLEADLRCFGYEGPLWAGSGHRPGNSRIAEVLNGH